MRGLHQLAGVSERLDPPARDDVEVELPERRRYLVELSSRNSELEILVFTTLLPEEEIDRPTGRHVPGHGDLCEPCRRLLGPPGVPFRIVPTHAATQPAYSKVAP